MENVKNKLEPLKQWVCDYCGDIIEKSKDAMLEWDNRDLETSNYRIVHGRWLKTCNVGRDDTYLSDNHLDRFLGDDGLINLLGHFEFYKPNKKGLIEIIKRLHVKHYEEGSKFLSEAIEDGYHEIDSHQVGDLYQSDLRFLINKYS